MNLNISEFNSEYKKEAESKLMAILTTVNCRKLLEGGYRRFLSGQTDENYKEYRYNSESLETIRYFMSNNEMGDYISDFEVTKSGKSFKFVSHYIYDDFTRDYKVTKRGSINHFINNEKMLIIKAYDLFLNEIELAKVEIK